MLRDDRNEILRTILGGLGVAVVLAATGWPTDLIGALLTLLGAVAGVTLAFGVEHALDRRVDVGELQQRVRDLEAADEQHAADRRMLEYRLALAQRESAINANLVDVWGESR
jgi:hypothetical protein